MLQHRSFAVCALRVGLFAFGPGSVAAQDERPLGWTDVAEFTFVLTSGNATSSTLGLKNTLRVPVGRGTLSPFRWCRKGRVRNHHSHGDGVDS